MRYSRNIWQQLKNLTADDLMAALERDGWTKDRSEGAFIPYINPKTRMRVILHYHPRKTYGPNLLKSLLDEIGWNERDLLRIGLIAGKSKSTPQRLRIAEVGDENPNGQLFALRLISPEPITSSTFGNCCANIAETDTALTEAIFVTVDVQMPGRISGS